MMKFPSIFRVFAVLNILLFILMSVVTIGILLYPNAELFYLAVAATFLAIWSIVSGLVWFIGSDKSYPFLYLSAIAGLLFTAAVARIAVPALEMLNKDDILFLFIVILLGFIYSLLLFVSMFIGSVKAWINEQGATRQRFSPVSATFFVVLAVAVYAGYFFANKLLSTSLTIDSTFNTAGSTGGCTAFNLNTLTEFDGLRISGDNASAGRVVVMFADSYEATEPGDYFRTDTIVFSEEGLDYLSASFSAVWARRVLICETGTAFAPAGIDLQHKIGLFEETSRLESFFVYDGTEAPVEYHYDDDGAAYEDEYTEADLGELPSYSFLPEEAPKVLDSAARTQLFNLMLRQMLNTFSGGSANYYFNDYRGTYTMKKNAVGTYIHFNSLFNDYLFNAFYSYAGETHQGEDFENLNEVMHAISGLNLYQGYSENEVRHFQSLNPPFVEWLGKNMVPAPRETFFGVKAQTIYDISFRRMAWMLAASYEHLAIERNWENEALVYQGNFENPDFYGPTYLHERFSETDFTQTAFSKVYEQFPAGEYEYYYFTEQVAIGFWLRRRLDGSSEEVYEMLAKILKKYDNYTWG